MEELHDFTEEWELYLATEGAKEEHNAGNDEQQTSDEHTGAYCKVLDDIENDEEKPVYKLQDDERCVKIADYYYVFDVHTFDSYVNDQRVEYWQDSSPEAGPLCFAFNSRRRCIEPECPCARGEKCRNVGPGLTCDVQDCPKPNANHNRWSCHFKYGRLAAKGKFKARRQLSTKPANFPSNKGGKSKPKGHFR